MHPFATTLAAIALIATLTACERKPVAPSSTASNGYKQLPTTPTATSPLTSPPQITLDMEEGFVDLTFYLSDYSTAPDGSQTFTAKGFDKTSPVAFTVKLEPSWKGSELVKGIDVHSGVVHLLSAGPESDQLVKSLDRLYGTKLEPEAMTNDAKLGGIALEGTPRSPQSGPLRIKLFHESDKEDQYAEFFVNIDLPNKRIELREKDDGYRRAVVRAFSAH